MFEASSTYNVMHIAYYFVVTSLHIESEREQKDRRKNKNAFENFGIPGRYDGKIDFINLYLGRNKN